jgi:hypothetical protein
MPLPSNKASNGPIGISTPKKSKQRKTSNESAGSSSRIKGNTAGAGHLPLPLVVNPSPPFPLLESSNKPSFVEGFAAVADLLRGKRNIVVLAGAGISVSCGIPDFRSKGSGLYSTLNFRVSIKSQVLESYFCECFKPFVWTLLSTCMSIVLLESGTWPVVSGRTL